MLARAIAIGAQAPTNPYLQASNKKKVSGLGGLVGGWGEGTERACKVASGWWGNLIPATSCYFIPGCSQVVVRDLNPKSLATQELCEAGWERLGPA